MNYFNESLTQETEMKKTFEKTSVGTGCEENKMMESCPQMPVYECPQERVCHRYICYEVPHIMPVNTRVINHHVYRHTYRPEYTCSEENVCENVFDSRCF